MKDSEHYQLEEKFKAFAGNQCEWHEEIDSILLEIVEELANAEYIAASVKLGIIIEKNDQQHKKNLEEIYTEDEEENDD